MGGIIYIQIMFAIGPQDDSLSLLIFLAVAMVYTVFSFFLLLLFLGLHNYNPLKYQNRSIYENPTF